MQTQHTHSEIELPPQDVAREYLANLQGLTRELDQAMTAIAQRELPTLQESIRRQQARCNELTHLRSREGFVQQLQPGAGSIGPDLEEEIQAATQTLLMLNRQYSALLKHSGNTLRLLVGLFRSYHGPDQVNSGLNPNRQTWSCEV
jgi:hypothetical protein